MYIQFVKFSWIREISDCADYGMPLHTHASKVCAHNAFA